MVAERVITDLGYNCVCKCIHPKAGGLCTGCRASQQGRNCWEMNISPCCDLPRTSCDTCPVYAAAMRELALTQHVRILVEGGTVIEGEVFARRGHRVSDMLNDPERSHIAVANAVVRHGEETGLGTQSHPVVLVAKTSARLIYPLDPPPDG